jgi:hypothetical protein
LLRVSISLLTSLINILSHRLQTYFCPC